MPLDFGKRSKRRHRGDLHEEVHFGFQMLRGAARLGGPRRFFIRDEGCGGNAETFESVVASVSSPIL